MPLTIWCALTSVVVCKGACSSEATSDQIGSVHAHTPVAAILPVALAGKKVIQNILGGA